MNYKPPKAVQAEAKRALKWIEDGHAGQGFTDTGRKRASDLARGAEVSRETIGRIANYLARHESDKQGKGWSPGEDGFPSAGRVAWAAWGGDPAKPWTAAIISSEEKSDAREGCECWDGYCRVPGTEPCSPGSCEKCDAHRTEEKSGRSAPWNGAKMTALKNRERIIDVREERTGATPFEFREDVATGQVILRGYAATYEPYDCYGGPDSGGWVEQLNQNSFKRTLEANPDVMLLLNHGGAPLARTKSGTMTLTADRRGLLVEARLDPSDPDVQALLPKMRRGDLDEMSFAFRVKDQEWDNNYSHRMITEVSLQKGDVSVVNYGMNPNTHVVIAETVGALAKLSRNELAELRNLDTGLIERAISNLTRVAKGTIPPQEKDTMDDKDKEACGMVEPDADEVGGPSDDDADEKKAAVCDCCGEEGCDGDCENYGDEKPVRVDATIASALDSSLLTAYSLAGANPELQRKLKSARSQLNKLVGKDEVTDIDRRLLDLRKEVGLPDTQSISDAFEYIRREGTDPATAMSLAWNDPDS